MTNPAPLKYVAVIRPDGEGRVLTTSDDRLRVTVDHETRIGSTVIGEYTDLGVAQRAAKLAEKGWRLPANREAS